MLWRKLGQHFVLQAIRRLKAANKQACNRASTQPAIAGKSWAGGDRLVDRRKKRLCGSREMIEAFRRRPAIELRTDRQNLVRPRGYELAGPVCHTLKLTEEACQLASEED
jgi:hypothetical protein